LTELDTDKVPISDYEIDAIVEKVVKEIKHQIICTSLIIITYIAVNTAIILYTLLG